MNFYLGGPLFIVFFLALGIALSWEPAPSSEETDAVEPAGAQEPAD